MQYRPALIIFVTLFFFSACSGQELYIEAEEPANVTHENKNVGPTITPTPSATPTIAPTLVPSQTPTATPDLSVLGNPAKPMPRNNSPMMSMLQFDPEAFHVYEREIHGRIVTIAWEKSANIPESDWIKISDFYMETFIRHWEVFGGYPWSFYTVIFQNENNWRWGEGSPGYIASPDEYIRDDIPKEMISHEVAHSWLTGAIGIGHTSLKPNIWYEEGITSYYGYRGAGIDEYNAAMMRAWDGYYLPALNTKYYDVPLTEMGIYGQEDSYYIDLAYRKGALVAYMMDLELRKEGLTLDGYVRYLYNNYGKHVGNFSLSIEDALKALNTYSGMEWRDFFDKYIYGTDPLPIAPPFEFLP